MFTDEITSHDKEEWGNALRKEIDYDRFSETERRCIICGFADKQEDIIEITDGYIHKECMRDNDTLLEPGYSPIRNLENYKA